jgi:hypothetical protein
MPETGKMFKIKAHYLGEKIMFRKLAILAILAVVLAAAYGAAAALNVNGGVVQAGGDDTLACDTDGVQTQWETFVTNGKFHVTAVEVSGINAACDGNFVMVALMKTPTQIVGFMRSPVAISGGFAKASQCYDGGWVPCNNGSGPAAEDVNSVQVVFKSAFTANDAP